MIFGSAGLGGETCSTSFVVIRGLAAEDATGWTNLAWDAGAGAASGRFGVTVGSWLELGHCGVGSASGSSGASLGKRQPTFARKLSGKLSDSLGMRDIVFIVKYWSYRIKRY
jgi:hypothetical protein